MTLTSTIPVDDIVAVAVYDCCYCSSPHPYYEL